jgi:hypothetical protein
MKSVARSRDLRSFREVLTEFGTDFVDPALINLLKTPNDEPQMMEHGWVVGELFVEVFSDRDVVLEVTMTLEVTGYENDVNFIPSGIHAVIDPVTVRAPSVVFGVVSQSAQDAPDGRP